MKGDVKEKKILPAPLGDAGVVTYIQPHLIPHLILRGVIGLVALARRTFPRGDANPGLALGALGRQHSGRRLIPAHSRKSRGDCAIVHWISATEKPPFFQRTNFGA